MAHKIGYCCLTLAMLGSGVLPRTAEFGWLPGAVQSKARWLKPHQAPVLVSHGSGKPPIWKRIYFNQGLPVHKALADLELCVDQASLEVTVIHLPLSLQ